MCISEQECDSQNVPGDTANRSEIFIPFNGFCLNACPLKFEELALDEQGSRFVCVPSRPEVTCDSITITDHHFSDPQLLNAFKRCRVVRDFVNVSIKDPIENLCGPKRNGFLDFLIILSNIEEIYGYLSVQGSPFIENLGIFTNLKRIRGTKLFDGKYSLVLTDNSKLAFSWVLNQNVTIDRGESLIQRNKKNPLIALDDPRFIKVDIQPKAYVAAVSWTLPSKVDMKEGNIYRYFLYTKGEFLDHFYCPTKNLGKLV